jgi:hypothetical protein
VIESDELIQAELARSYKTLLGLMNGNAPRVWGVLYAAACSGNANIGTPPTVLIDQMFATYREHDEEGA